jgi:hypothetical protein
MSDATATPAATTEDPKYGPDGRAFDLSTVMMKPLADFVAQFPCDANGDFVVLLDPDFAGWLLQRSGHGHACFADRGLVNPIALKLTTGRQHDLDDVTVVVSPAGRILSGLETVAAIVAANPPVEEGKEPRKPIPLAALLRIDTAPVWAGRMMGAVGRAIDTTRPT